MKRIVTSIALACAVAATMIAAHAANTDPFDFDYEIDGGIAERPALIFNDGSKTYIQPRAGQVITADGGHPEGPYVVVQGTPALIHYTIGLKSATAHWSRANTFIGGTGVAAAARDDEPPGFDGFSNRLVLIGSHATLESVRELRATMPIGSLIKALVPHGWTGAAQKDVDLTDMSTFETQPGENWMQSLDRLMTLTGLYADVDFNARHIRVHRDAPKSAALDYAAGAPAAGAVKTHASEPDNGGGAAIADGAAPSAQGSLLAEHFGAQAIRDGDDTHTQIRFAAKPAHELTFTTPEGTSLHPRWDHATNVVTIDRAQRFLVSDGTTRVEVARAAGEVYDFDKANPAHLEAVFDKEGSTYFKFADSVVHASVADVRHLGSGAQKGRYYRFDGIADQFIVTGDGKTVSVTRRHDVQYSERPGSTP
ncbi:MAG: TrbG/VirB9 family P-type conjugative transfer protein [Burkholderiales bacterium]|nr:TrbG/VirB9 family P-type conjugative transfer protein [Burkholderiales bacterium]